VLTMQVIVEPAGTDWGAIIGASLAAIGTLAGVIVGGRGSRRAKADAVRREAYAEYLTAAASLIANRKQSGGRVTDEQWRTLRAARYTAQLVGSTAVAKKARDLSAAVGEPLAHDGIDFNPDFEPLIIAMQSDLRVRSQDTRTTPWYGLMGGA
jgi:hypothetical protein